MSNKFKNIIVSVLFLTILLLVFVLNILKPDTEISMAERRKLEQFPSFTFHNLFNGTFFSKFDTYVNDQFISRDSFRTAKAKLDLTFKGNYHNIYIKNDYLVEQTYPLSYASVTNLTKKITDIKNNYLVNNKIYFSIVPDKNYFVNNNNLKMDYDLLESKMKENLDFATYIKILDKLDLTDYYKTDSHWKQENIQKVADELLKGMNNYSSSSYNVENIAKFKGTYAYRVPVNTDFDEINIMTNDILKNARVFNYTTNTYTNVYDLLRWERMLHTGKILSQESYNEMITPSEDSGYGFGLIISDGIIRHSGVIDGFNSYTEYDSAKDITIIILENYDPSTSILEAKYDGAIIRGLIK